MNPSSRQTVFGLYMVVFVLTAIVAAVMVGYPFFDIPQTILTYCLLTLILAAGLRCLLKRNAEGYAGCFVRGIATILTQKWLFTLIGILLGISILDGLLYWGMERYFLTTESGRALTQSLSGGILGSLSRTHHFTSYDLAFSLFRSIQSSLDYFALPIGLGTRYQMAVGLVVLVVLLPPFARKLRVLEQKPELKAGAAFLRKLIVPTAILSVLVILCQPYMNWMNYELLSRGGASHAPLSSGLPQLFLIVRIVALILDAFLIKPALLAGIIASLRCVRSGQAATWDTFVEGIVVFFKPLLGFSVVIMIVGNLLLNTYFLSLPMDVSTKMQAFGALRILLMLFNILVMFCPFTLAFGATGVRSMFMIGIRDWLASWRKTWAFIAVGVVIAATLAFPMELTKDAIAILSPLRAVSVLISSLSPVLITYVLTVSILEYYSRVVKSEDACPPAAEVTE